MTFLLNLPSAENSVQLRRYTLWCPLVEEPGKVFREHSQETYTQQWTEKQLPKISQSIFHHLWHRALALSVQMELEVAMNQ